MTHDELLKKYKESVDNRISLDDAYMRNAYTWAERSKAIRKKTGAVLVKNDQTISDGFNGMPAGSIDDCCEYLDDSGNLVTKPEVLHAEANAILKIAANDGPGTAGSTLYCTMSPCVECAKLIIQAKIKKVVYHERYRIVDGLEILKRHGIIVEQLIEEK